MKDLTHGSIVSHILTMAPPIVAGMVTIMICQLVDLYFVAGLGDAAIAGVAAAGNAGFLINALMQVLGVGTVALISACRGAQGSGRRQSGVQPVARPVRGVRAADVGCGIGSRSQLHGLGCRRRSHRRGGHYLSALVHACTGAAIRHAGDGVRAAGHRNRASRA